MAQGGAGQPCDPIWTAIRAEAWSEQERDPILRDFLKQTVLKTKCLEDALSLQLSHKLATECVYPLILRALLDQTLAAEPAIGRAVRADLQAIRDRDPSARGYLVPFLYSKGFHALVGYRIANWFWRQDRTLFAAHLQNRISEVFGIDIHPGAQVGSGVLVGPGAGVIVAEGTVIADNGCLG